MKDSRQFLISLENRRKNLEVEWRAASIEHSRLNQIEMLSGTGAKLRDDIAELKGRMAEIDAMVKLIKGEL